MTHLPAAAHERLAAQHGAISRRQLLGAGLSDRNIATLVQRGDLHHFVRGAYVSPSAPLTEHARIAAICLARPEVAVCGPTAGRMWEVRKVGADRRLHLIAPPAANPINPQGRRDISVRNTAALRCGQPRRRHRRHNTRTNVA